MEFLGLIVYLFVFGIVAMCAMAAIGVAFVVCAILCFSLALILLLCL